MKSAHEVITKARTLIGCAYKWDGNFSGPEDLVTEANVHAWKIADPAHFSATKCSQLIKNFLGKYAGDCSGLVTYCLDIPKTYSGTLFDMCVGKVAFDQSRPLKDQMPNTEAVIVWREGHIGYSAGNGRVVESGSTKYGVKETLIDEPITGDPWTHYGYLKDYVEYPNTATVTLPTASTGNGEEMLAKGSTNTLLINALKINLNTLGYTLALNGVFDDALVETLKYEQKNNNLAADGTASDATMLKIAELVYNKAKKVTPATNSARVVELEKAIADIKATVAKY